MKKLVLKNLGEVTIKNSTEFSIDVSESLCIEELEDVIVVENCKVNDSVFDRMLRLCGMTKKPSIIVFVPNDVSENIDISVEDCDHIEIEAMYCEMFTFSAEGRGIVNIQSIQAEMAGIETYGRTKLLCQNLASPILTTFTFHCSSVDLRNVDAKVVSLFSHARSKLAVEGRLEQTTAFIKDQSSCRFSEPSVSKCIRATR